MKTTTAVVLAGGLGTRLKSVVFDRPKPMAEVCGRPFLEWLLDYWCEQDIQRFIICVGHLANKITQHFGSVYKGRSVEYLIENSPAGTGGALLRARRCLEGTQSFLLLNGDSFFAVELSVLETFANENRADWCLSLFQTSESDRFGGVEIDGHGRVNAFCPAGAGTARAANGGVYLVRSDALMNFADEQQQAISLESQLLPACIASGQRVWGHKFDRPFLDIGMPQDFRHAASFFRAYMDSR